MKTYSKGCRCSVQTPPILHDVENALVPSAKYGKAGGYSGYPRMP